MRSLLKLSLNVLLGIAVFGCGGSQDLQSTSSGDIPDWYIAVPRDPDYIFAANTATSRDLQLAIDKATTGARAEIGRQVGVKITGLQKKFDEETRVGNDSVLIQQFTSAASTIVSTSLSGSRVKYQKQMKDGDIWRAYVLVEYPVGAANASLMQAIKMNEELHTRLRATDAFKGLDEDVRKYSESKKDQR